MKLHFEPVCPENRKEIESLQIFAEQIGFIETVAECMTEADEFCQWRPLGIYDGDVLVGFAMYGYFGTSLHDGRLWLDRLLIDKNYQGLGYGKAAVAALVERLHREYNNIDIYLSVYEANKAAIALYKQIGFHFTGEYDTKGEKIMLL
ncbi:GNAT family N-acetyltransferase [Bariatricus massiliensis]|uniref:GNAT family N-acetyltransferase n=1 Tax=Bariatricus massiliensis TaxID=1745713 RepID=A0ABS8DM17_9FIRM|nr:GNAT family N-acetyltransferase [Bariatricus massiliensis]MCB7306066.1 GNAT family N-acetyltransferase [Bariatricus massiliensis]MCB7376565.1 GNAT family N-acetyltransferase [Bariatricus massiliensis]MCB7389209.1 GNAT family N-acetyltransferase [Bariatricus massiliensis]MCB7413382.1 GNAT family N-acetyltransferase [Bariatricus massiliensis]MCQ5255290.1 GNAT family N-acetyltransferase [Bariatricus massiliensis]